MLDSLSNLQALHWGCSIDILGLVHSNYTRCTWTMNPPSLRFGSVEGTLGVEVLGRYFMRLERRIRE
jgi:hypothetical protein